VWRPGIGVLVASVSLCGIASAQGSGTHRSLWAASAGAGTVHLSDTTSLDAVGGLIEYRPLGWLTFGAAPTVVRSKSGAVVTTGFGDLPLTAAASTDLGAAWGPQLAAAVILTVPTGNSACGLGSGETSAGMDLGVGISPADRVHLSVDASRSFSAITLSSLDAPQSTWLDLDADLDLTPRLTASGSLGGDFGGADTAGAPREVGAGARYALRGPLGVSVDVTHRLSGAAPMWGVSLTVGTAGGGLSPLNPNSPLRRQRQVFGGGVNAGHGHGKVGACP
jgi:hypothetical protein